MGVEKVLVTGATGFAGSHLCRRLAKAGYVVRALARDRNRGVDLQLSGVEVIIGDLRDPQSLRQASKGIDVVYHIAAVYREANLSRKEMWETNVLGTRSLLDAAIEAGVKRFVHCSTIGVHGNIKKPPANEETAYGPGDIYQETKAEGERVVRRYMAEGRLPVVVFRPAGIYGPGDSRFLKLFRAIQLGRFVMLGSGRITYHLVYIDDLIDGILLCGTQEKSLGEVFILGGKAPVTLNDLVLVIAQTLGVRPPKLRFPVTPVYVAALLCEFGCKPFGINPPLYRRRVDFFRKNRAFDISKARTALGFDPKTDLRTGIRLTSEWYRSKGLL